jgi:putative transposase
MMRKRRYSKEQIIAILREQEAVMATAEVCRRDGVSSATFYAWKSKYCAESPPAFGAIADTSGRQ